MNYEVLVQHRAKPGKKPTTEVLPIDAASAHEAEKLAKFQIKKTSKVLEATRSIGSVEDKANQGVNAF